MQRRYVTRIKRNWGVTRFCANACMLIALIASFPPLSTQATLDPAAIHLNSGREDFGLRARVATSGGPRLELEALAAEQTFFGPLGSFLSANDSFSKGIASGDFNGDGVSDLLIGAPGLGSPGVFGTRPGGAFIVFGKSGPDKQSLTDLSQNRDVVIQGIGNQGIGDLRGRIGFMVASGDINGDGIDDILLGDSESNGPDGKRGLGGEVNVIFGSRSLPHSINLSITPPDLVIFGRLLDGLGVSISVGDVNGDGVQDLLLGAPGGLGPGAGRRQGGNPSGLGPGIAYVLYGRPNFPAVIDLATEAADVVIFGEEGGDFLGISLAAGDLNGDGIAEIALGAAGTRGPVNTRAQSSGEVYIIHGSPSLPAVFDVLGEVGPLPDVRIYGAGDKAAHTLGDNLGWGLSIGDIEGDGVNDLLMGAESGGTPIGRIQAGAVYVIRGGAIPPVLDMAGEVGPKADITIWGASGSAKFGDDALGTYLDVADVNGDGIDDILVVAEHGDGPFRRINEGDVYVIYGGNLPPVLDMRGELGPGPDVIIYSGAGALDTSPALKKVAASDVDGDGINELIVGAPQASLPPFGSPEGRESAGAVFVFSIPRLLQVEPLTITAARYRGAQQILEVTVPGATADDKIEINGRLVGPFWNLRVPISFDASGSKFIVSGKKKALLLNKGKGTNTVVVIHKGVRSAAFTF